MHPIQSPLLTDFYQITMAYGYWSLGMAEREATFNLFYRKNPFGGDAVVACGLATVIDYLADYQFSTENLTYLSSLQDPTGKALFCTQFLHYLRDLRFACDVHAVPEGQLIFPHEPILRITGPLLQCQLIETPMVNLLGFASLVATKAARVCQAAGEDAVIEFGLRRAQGPNGGLTASRAAYIGGCDSVSNTLAGEQFGIPVKGTVAHSWIMSFVDELTAFRACVQVMPDNAILLVDTYDTLQGVKNAITVGKELRLQGRDLIGVRLDSGDLNVLSQRTRQMLDEAGFTDTKIIASGDLDEYEIIKLKQQGAPIDIWGVGTRLTTSYDQPALDAAYKLGAIQDEQGVWQHKIKRSDHPGKTTNPGQQQVRRYFCKQRWLGDEIYDEILGAGMQSPYLADENVSYEDLLLPIFHCGKLVYQSPAIEKIQHCCRQQLNAFNNSRIKDYPVQLEPRLAQVQKHLCQQTDPGYNRGCHDAE